MSTVENKNFIISTYFSLDYSNFQPAGRTGLSRQRNKDSRQKERSARQTRLI